MKIEMLAEQGKWNEILLELDRVEKNNNRRHKEKRDSMDISIVDQKAENDKRFPAAKMLNPSCDEDWIDIIFGSKAEDLHQLVTDENVSLAIKNLTDCQKEVLFLNIVQQYTTAEIAEMKFTTDRNVRKHRQKAIETIQKVLGILKSKSGSMDVAMSAKILVGMLFWPFLIGWKIANKIYPKRAA